MAEAPRRPRRIARTSDAGDAPRVVGQVRTTENLARQSAFMVSEMKRVAGISALCFGMLAILVVIDRLQ